MKRKKLIVMMLAANCLGASPAVMAQSSEISELRKEVELLRQELQQLKMQRTNIEKPSTALVAIDTAKISDPASLPDKAKGAVTAGADVVAVGAERERGKRKSSVFFH